MLKMRDEEEMRIDRDALSAAYAQGASSIKLAQENGCSIKTVLSILRSASVTVRPPTLRHQPRRIDFETREQEDRFIEIVDGLLLGDASISKPSAVAATIRIGQSPQNAPWLEQICSLLASVGVPCRTIECKTHYGSRINGRLIRSSFAHVLYTPAFAEFREQRTRWYPDGSKIVPRDVRLTPLSVALWLCGDGTCDDGGSIRFCTDGFDRESTEFLAKSLEEAFGLSSALVRPASTGGFHVAVMRRADAAVIKEMIAEFVPNCFVYKLVNVREPIPRGRALRRLTTAQVISIRERTAIGESLETLSEAFGVSQAALSRIVTGRCYADVGGPIRSTRYGTGERRRAGVHRRKFSLAEIHTMRNEISLGKSQSEIARERNVTRQTVARLVKHGYQE